MASRRLTGWSGGRVVGWSGGRVVGGEADRDAHDALLPAGCGQVAAVERGDDRVPVERRSRRGARRPGLARRAWMARRRWFLVDRRFGDDLVGAIDYLEPDVVTRFAHPGCGLKSYAAAGDGASQAAGQQRLPCSSDCRVLVVSHKPITIAAAARLRSADLRQHAHELPLPYQNDSRPESLETLHASLKKAERIHHPLVLTHRCSSWHDLAKMVASANVVAPTCQLISIPWPDHPSHR